MSMLPRLPSPIPLDRVAPGPRQQVWPGVGQRREERRLRALIVEDQPADAELLLRALREAGFEVQSDVVQNEEQFLDKIHSNTYDVVFADYTLPGWNGMESVELLRRENFDVPVILVTGSLGEIRAVECLKEGAADYILKDHLARLPESVHQAVREKDLREENRRNHEELARSNRDLEQFAYAASHDLQEPLRMMAAYTQLLEEKYHGKLDEEAEKYTRYIIEGAIRMQALVEALLAFSRVGRQRMELQTTDCNLVVEMACKNLEAAIKESGAAIEHDRLPAVVADPSLLLQVFQNLVGNAIKFRGPEAPLIRISAEKQDREWAFAVADNGIGVAAEHSQAIFALFRRLHTHRAYPGSGIGLSICKKILEQHGGKIWVQPNPGQGSIFKFTLPVLIPRRKHEISHEPIG